VGSIPDEAIGFFNSLNPYSRTMALGPTQALTAISTRNLPEDKGQPAHTADNLNAICARLSKNVGASISQNPMGLHSLLQGQLYLFFIYY
jgi:hypothetical protein